MEQETLEEAAERLCPNSSWKHGFIAGAKWQQEQETTLDEAKLRQLFKNRSNCYIENIKEWQQERRYSEEQVLELLLSRPGPYLTDEEIKEWFEKFKKI
jgi:hypothetical protein